MDIYIYIYEETEAKLEASVKKYTRIRAILRSINRKRKPSKYPIDTDIYLCTPPMLLLTSDFLA